MVDLFKDVISSLNDKKDHLFDSDQMVPKDYVPFIVNKCFSFSEDILLSNIMNMSSHLTPRMQYDFYFYGLDKKKRYNKWVKKRNINRVDDIIKYCNCSYKRALEYCDVLSEEQFNKIKEVNNRMNDNVQ